MFRLGFVGSGQMATAIAAGVVSSGLLPGDAICTFDPNESTSREFAKQAPGAVVLGSNAEVLKNSETVLLAVKPQVLSQVSAALKGMFRADQLLVSILAGITIERLAEATGAQRVVRVMPNTPCLVRQGVSGFACCPEVSASQKEFVKQVLGAVGDAYEIGEHLINPLTGVSGSGPAYVMSFIESVSDGGVLMGLPRDLATKLAIQTVLGAASLAKESSEHPAVLRERVTSPGGTTAAALQALDDRAFRGAVIAAVQAASKRADELGKN